MLFRRLFCLCSLLLLAPLATVSAQQSRDDSARVVLDAARVLDRRGESTLARQLLRFLQSRWPDSPAAREARGTLAAAVDAPVAGLGRTSFITYHTALGAWLGVAIPAALGAHGTEPYGAGLLIGAPAGFFASQRYAKRQVLTEGQAEVIAYGSQFGMWQAVGWSTVLGLGDRTVCYGEGDYRYCSEESPDRRGFTASIVGAAAGLAGGVVASRTNISSGTAAMVSHGGYWGTWLGLATGMMLDPHEVEHRRLTAALAGGAIGTGLAVPLARAWQPSATRVRLISASGVAGGLAGVGAALLTGTERTRGVVALILAGNAAGIGLATALTHDRDLRPAAGQPADALVSLRDDLRLGIPLPTPTLLRADRSPLERHWVAGVRLPLLDVEF